VECVRYDGTIHGFFSMAVVIDLGKEDLENVKENVFLKVGLTTKKRGKNL
jgi:hypothetical protein